MQKLSFGAGWPLIDVRLMQTCVGVCIEGKITNHCCRKLVFLFWVTLVSSCRPALVSLSKEISLTTVVQCWSPFSGLLDLLLLACFGVSIEGNISSQSCRKLISLFRLTLVSSCRPALVSVSKEISLTTVVESWSPYFGLLWSPLAGLRWCLCRRKYH